MINQLVRNPFTAIPTGNKQPSQGTAKEKQLCLICFVSKPEETSLKRLFKIFKICINARGQGKIPCNCWELTTEQRKTE